MQFFHTAAYLAPKFLTSKYQEQNIYIKASAKSLVL